MCEINEENCENCECAEMSGRQWIEFGKMFNNMIQENWEVELQTSSTPDGDAIYNVTLFVTGDESTERYIDDETWYLTPYKAIKAVYWEHFLNTEYDVETRDIPDEELAELYIQADKEGITIDELIMNIEEEDPYITEAECCSGCEYMEWIDTDHPTCTLHNVKVRRNLTCPDFESK